MKVTKLQLKTSDELWKDVLKYKTEKGLKNDNEAIEELINMSLHSKSDSNKDILYIKDIDVDENIKGIIKNFRENIPLLEKKERTPLIILEDKKAKAVYSECHIYATDLVNLSDANATIDPDLQEEFRANRDLEPNNSFFIQMLEDAKNGRQFSDLVIEYNTTYEEKKPLKILGGQHRNEAIKRAFEENAVNQVHGIRVYFNLNKDQRAEIMRISNTNINVSSDLRDRIEETRLNPAGMLRDFCYKVDMLDEGEDFGDKKRFEEDFSPTVRMVRSFIVNFYHGLEYTNDIDKDAIKPYLCNSGRQIDQKYLSIFEKYKNTGFDDKELIEAGKMFTKLHDAQFNKADSIQGSSKKAYKIKAYSLAVITSWAFAASVLQRVPQRLEKLYSLPDLSGNDDPLNAKAMSKAKHKFDSDTYRGLGTRNDEKERGRLLHLFLGYSSSTKPKITEQMCNAAISIFHSNDDVIKAEEKRKRAFE